MSEALADIGEIVAPNRLRDERLAAGIATPEELAQRAGIDPVVYGHIESGRVLATKAELERLLAALGGIHSSRIYVINFRQLIAMDEKYSALPPTELIRRNAGAKELLIARDEVTWRSDRRHPDGPVDVFLSLSCGPQAAPHLLQDTIAVCDALGLSYFAAAGAAGCCGKPFAARGRFDVSDNWLRAKTAFAVDIGAKAVVAWCTACQARNTTAAATSEVIDGIAHPVRETQILRYLLDQIRARGDRVPWKRAVERRVLMEGHDRMSPVHAAAQRAGAELLALVPGVTVVGLYDGYSPESPCAGGAREESYGTWQRDDTAEDVQAHRRALADMAESRGADTIACQHQGCHMSWSRYASDRLAVRHPVSIVAEGLGCAHPDRYQAAAILGDPAEIVDQTRPVWTTWGITEARALELAKMVADERYAKGLTSCGCGGGAACGEELISVDVLTGSRSSYRPA